MKKIFHISVWVREPVRHSRAILWPKDIFSQPTSCSKFVVPYISYLRCSYAFPPEPEDGPQHISYKRCSYAFPLEPEAGPLLPGSHSRDPAPKQSNQHLPSSKKA